MMGVSGKFDFELECSRLLKLETHTVPLPDTVKMHQNYTVGNFEASTHRPPLGGDGVS